MNRTTKNAIMTIALVTTIGITGYTTYSATSYIPVENLSMDLPQQPSEDSVPSTPPDQPSERQATSTSSLPSIYYVSFGLESVTMASFITYLALSQMNKKTWEETFMNIDKKIMAALSIALLTETLMLGQSAVVTYANGPTMVEGMPGNESNTVSYSAIETISSDTTIKDETITSNEKNENAILVDGEYEVTLDGTTIEKSGDSNDGDSTSFYGQNSGILAKGGANVTITDATITTNATGANGVFSYGGSATTNNSSSDGTTVTIKDSTITTTEDNAGGIMTTGGGTMIATNLTVETAGTSSAAIRTDRGGGNVTVKKGTYTTTGVGSPAIYSTADITVSDATLVAEASEGVVIEGNNSVTLENVDLTDTNTKLNGQSTTYKNIFLYQSQSGDAADGNSTFTATDSTITTNNGDTLYVTNATAIFNLKNNTIVNNDADGNFLRAQADSWGQEGSNGGDVTLNMMNQDAVGNIVIDAISSLTMNMSSKSYYEGTINGDNSASNITLKLDASSKIKLTGDSYVTSLEDEDETYSNIDFNGFTLYVNGVAINS